MSCYVRGTLLAFFFGAFLHSFIVFGQTPDSSQKVAEFQLNVGGEVERPLKLSLADLAKLPRRTVQAKDHDRPEATFEGVPLMEILQLAGIKFGEKLRGQALATYLLVEASDGYKVVFALAELDSAFTDHCSARKTPRAMGSTSHIAHDPPRLIWRSRTRFEDKIAPRSLRCADFFSISFSILPEMAIIQRKSKHENSSQFYSRRQSACYSRRDS